MYSSTETAFTINTVHPIEEQELFTGFYIVITNALAVPPHLGLLLNGQLSSLSVKGASVNGNLHGFIRMLKAKDNPTLFVHLKIPENSSVSELQEKITQYVLSYACVNVSKQITCLSPIKDVMEHVFNIPVNNVNVIFDLLPVLHHQHVILSYFGYNLQDKLTDEKISLQKYTLHEVNTNIENTFTSPI
jgi:hypothetical protein